MLKVKLNEEQTVHLSVATMFVVKERSVSPPSDTVMMIVREDVPFEVPERIKILVVEVNCKLPVLPKSLEIIKLRDSFNSALPDLREHTNLKEVIFQDVPQFDHDLDLLPDTVEVLHISYNHPINKFPTGLGEFQGFLVFNRLVSHLPEGVKLLDLRYSEFNRLLTKLLRDLEELHLNYFFDQDLSQTKFPKGLHKLRICETLDFIFTWCLETQCKKVEAP